MLFGLALVLSGCAPKDTDPPECVHDPVLTYQNFGEGFMQQYCVGCHSSHLPDLTLRNDAPVGVDFDTYGSVLQWKERIKTRTQYGIETPMPPGGGPREDEYLVLQEWLACDAQDDWDQVFGEGGE